MANLRCPSFYHACLTVLLLLATSAAFTSAGRTLLDVADDSADPPAALAANPGTTNTTPTPTGELVAPTVAPVTATTEPATPAAEHTPATAEPVTPAAVVAPSASTTTEPVIAPAAGVVPVTTSTKPVTPAAVAPSASTTTEPVTPAAGSDVPVTTNTKPVTPAAAVAPVINPTPAAGAAPVVDAAHHPALTFYMHDILGGTNPSARVITGIISNPAVTGQLPFARPNNAVFSNNNPANIPNGNNNVPFLTGLGGQTTSSIISTNNGGINSNIIGGVNGLPFFNSGQMPAGSTIQKLLFGTMTVIDDVLTEGHELGSGMVGKAQGFYVASSEDGLSQTMAFTAMFGSNHYGDCLCLFGVHKVGVEESLLAVMGGTGKYVKAKGFASVKTMPVPAVATDGAETLLEINVYLAA